MAMVIVATALACAAQPRAGGSATPKRTPPDSLATLDALRAYRDAGLIARSGSFPLLGTVAYFASGSADTTLTLVSLSFSNRELSFTREGDRYKASYVVKIEDRVGLTTAQRFDATETVRVATFRETERSDESVIYQQMMKLAPGPHTIAIAIRDEGSTRAAGEEYNATVPRLGAGGLSSAIAVNEVTPRDSLTQVLHAVASPRSTAIFGHDSTIDVYVEGYARSDAGTTAPRLSLSASLFSDSSAPIWTDTLSIPRHGALYSGTVALPVPRIGLGAMRMRFARIDSGDSASIPVFVSFGDELPVTNFENMLSYLRYFAPAERLARLRAVAPSERAAAWAAFLRETDPVPSTPQHEGLTDYFARVQQANERYTEGFTQGWLTDRGEVFISLGAPDQIFEQGGNDASHLRRTQVWDYRQYQAQLVFVDAAGIGRWRMTPSSESQFQQIMRKLQGEH